MSYDVIYSGKGLRLETESPRNLCYISLPNLSRATRIDSKGSRSVIMRGLFVSWVVITTKENRAPYLVATKMIRFGIQCSLHWFMVEKHVVTSRAVEYIN